MNADAIKQFVELYNKTSKHSNYQVLAPELQEIIKPESILVKTRQERERLDYIRKHVNLGEKTLIDVGGNTGYFTFEAIRLGASSVKYFEGNAEHAEFVKKAALALGYEQRLEVFNEYLNFGTNEQNDGAINADVMLLLNVLHHIGDDFGDQEIAKSDAMKEIGEALHALSHSVKTLVFQLGFNWKGNRNLPLFANGTKKELIEFVRKATDGVWSIDHIGIATRHESSLRYEELNNQNIERDDSLGEFLNRPIFIMSSLQSQS